MIDIPINPIGNQLAIALILPDNNRHSLPEGLQDRTAHALAFGTVNHDNSIPEHLKINPMWHTSQVDHRTQLLVGLLVVLFIYYGAYYVHVEVVLVDNEVQLRQDVANGFHFPEGSGEDYVRFF